MGFEWWTSLVHVALLFPMQFFGIFRDYMASEHHAGFDNMHSVVIGIGIVAWIACHYVNLIEPCNTIGLLLGASMSRIRACPPWLHGMMLSEPIRGVPWAGILILLILVCVRLWVRPVVVASRRGDYGCPRLWELDDSFDYLHTRMPSILEKFAAKLEASAKDLEGLCTLHAEGWGLKDGKPENRDHLPSHVLSHIAEYLDEDIWEETDSFDKGRFVIKAEAKHSEVLNKVVSHLKEEYNKPSSDPCDTCETEKCIEKGKCIESESDSDSD